MLVGTVLFNIFGGDFNPQDDLMKMAHNYLQSAIDSKSVDPSVILDRYLKNGKEESLKVVGREINMGELSRRDFLKLVGLTLAGLAFSPQIKAIDEVVDFPKTDYGCSRFVNGRISG